MMSKPFASINVAGAEVSLVNVPANDLFDPSADAEIVLVIGDQYLQLSLESVRELKRLLSMGESKLLAEYDQRMRSKNLSFSF